MLKYIKKMNMGRLERFAYKESVLKWEIRQQGFDLSQYETAYVLKRGELYFAFNSKTAGTVIQKLQKALDELKLVHLSPLLAMGRGGKISS